MLSVYVPFSLSVKSKYSVTMSCVLCFVYIKQRAVGYDSLFLDIDCVRLRFAYVVINYCKNIYTV